MKINTCLLTFLVTVMLFVGSHTNLKGIDAADQEYAAICAGCHPTLTETLPKGHAVIDAANGHAVIEDTNPIFCKKCHSNPGSTKTFEWLIHFKHYSVADDEIDCEVCHILGKEENNGPPGRKTPQTILPPALLDDGNRILNHGPIPAIWTMDMLKKAFPAAPVMEPPSLLRSLRWKNVLPVTKRMILLRHKATMRYRIHIGRTWKALHVHFAIKLMKSRSIIATIIIVMILISNIRIRIKNDN